MSTANGSGVSGAPREALGASQEGLGIASDAEERKRTILSIEDDTAVRNLVRTALELRGYRCEEAKTGTAGLAAIASRSPDAVLLDLGLPDIDGVEVIRKIRTWADTPIIVLSARAEDADKIEALDAGADDYLTKPFSVEELLARLRVTFRRLAREEGGATPLAGSAPASRFENGELLIDYAAGTASMAGEELHLTPIEYRLLCLLARNVGKVLTHRFILREVWGSGAVKDRELASLRVFMGSLRKKIEADPAHPVYIQTHVGVGYRMLRV